MNICIVSLYTDEIEDLVLHTSANQRQYAQQHGYDYKLFRGRFSHRHPAWDKIKAVEVLLPHYDYVLWVDSDCIFRDMATPLESFIKGKAKYKGFFGKDPDPNNYVNSGVFLLKNHPWSFELLKYTWRSGAAIPNTNAIDKHSYSGWPYEQGPICEFLKTDKKNHYIIPEYIFNCPGYWESERSFILHFMGCRTTQDGFLQTIQRIRDINLRKQVSIIQNTTPIPKQTSNTTEEIVYSKHFALDYKGSPVALKVEVSRENVMSFEYNLPVDFLLSHRFKVNGKEYSFGSEKINALSYIVPAKFDLLHSFDFFGEIDYQLLDSVNLPS